MSRISVNQFLDLNWLNVHDRYLKLIVSDIFKFYNNQYPDYFTDVFCPVDNTGVATCCCNINWNCLLMQSLSNEGQSTWNKLPNNLKTATSLNCLSTTLRNTSLRNYMKLK